MERTWRDFNEDDKELPATSFTIVIHFNDPPRHTALDRRREREKEIWACPAGFYH